MRRKMKRRNSRRSMKRKRLRKGLKKLIGRGWKGCNSKSQIKKLRSLKLQRRKIKRRKKLISLIWSTLEI